MIASQTLRRRRVGFSLLEMIVASASATVLIAGLSSSIFVASRAFDDSDGTITRNLDASFVADEILTDLQLATSYTQRSATAVEFKVPDRDGDGNHETIRYAWSGSAGDPLTKEINASAPEAILDNIADLNLEYFTRTLTGVEAPIIFIPQVQFEEFEETKLTDIASSISIAVPVGTSPDDLLVAAVSVVGVPASNLKQVVPGWTLIGLDAEEQNIALAIWGRIASSGEPNQYTFQLGSDTTAYGWMMRFTGHNTSSPIADIQLGTGTSKFPQLPEAKVPSDNGFVLRIGGLADSKIRK